MSNLIKNSLILCLITLSISSIDGKLCREVFNITTNCDELFELVIHCNSDFVTHSMNLSNPFTVCSDKTTFLSYRLGLQFYEKLITTRDPHDHSALCSDKYLNKNRMNLITSFLGNSRSLWESANCDDCYYNSSSTVHNYSRNTEEFFGSHAAYHECVQNVTTKQLNMSLVCLECDAKYTTLNHLYEKIKKSTGNKICFDLEDKMNKTRRDWSSLYKCCKGKRDSLTAFFSLASAIIIIAISFYCSVYYVGIKYPSTETLDEREVSREGESMEQDEPAPSTSQRPSSSASSANRDIKPKKLVINQDESDDDQILSSSMPQVPLQSDLIKLIN